MEKIPEQVKKQIDESTKEADPTTYSILSIGKKRTKILRNPFVKYKLPLKTDGKENYYELCNDGPHSPKGQQVISRMLKGVINVSDIISEVGVDGVKKYYSLEMNHEKIEQKSTKEMVRADQLFLEFIFNSNDHHLNMYSGWANNALLKNDKVSHFDFGEDAYYFLSKPKNIDTLVMQIQQLKREDFLYLKEKVVMLNEQFSGEEGRLFFDSIIKSTGESVVDLFGPKEVFGYYPDKKPEDVVYENLIERSNDFLKIINSIENK